MAELQEIDFDELDRTVWQGTKSGVYIKRTTERKGIEIAAGSDIVVVWLEKEVSSSKQKEVK